MLAAIALSHPIPNLLRVGQTMTVSGRLKPDRSKTEIALEYRGTSGLQPKRWTVLAEVSPNRAGGFTLRWQATQATSSLALSMRIAAIHGGKAIATTKPATIAIGAAAVPCAAPVPPAVNIPVGSGWIEGGAYIMGGAFPGVEECVSQTYTVTATDTATGQVAATMTVQGGHSYTLVVPAGSYTLSTAGGCPARGMATVTAGHGTTADADCDVP
jgi:hypothetical protein